MIPWLLPLSLLAGAPMQASCAAQSGAMTVRLLDLDLQLSEGTIQFVQPAEGNGGGEVFATPAVSQPLTVQLAQDALLGPLVEVELPPLLRKPVKVTLLGRTAGVYWVGVPGMLLRFSQREQTLAGEVALTVRGEIPMPQPLRVDDDLLVVAGSRLYRCAPDTPCAELQRLPGEVIATTGSGNSWLLAVHNRTASASGLYRIVGQHPESASQLMEGQVQGFCSGERGKGWALLQKGRDQRLVAASADTPALRVFTAEELVEAALIESPELPDAAAVAEIVSREALQGWPRRAEILRRLALAKEAALRKVAADLLDIAEPPGADGLLWLLAHDADSEVRGATLDASQRRCKDAPKNHCIGWLSGFVDDAEPDIAWAARDLLVPLDAERALEDAPSAYKLELLAHLAPRVAQDPTDLQPLLQRLSRDPDPEVSSYAQVVIDKGMP